MGINLFTGNKLDILSEALSKVIGVPLSSPFVKEHFIVQSKGMERYINLTLAKNDGISANIKFLFPNQLVDEIFNLTVRDYSSLSFYRKETLTFRIMDILSGNIIEKDKFYDLKKYINSYSSNLKLYQISSKIADIFDQYLLYRPEMIKQWEKGAASHWQAQLFREIASYAKEPHRIEQFEMFKENISAEILKKTGIERLNIFGISSMPQYHLELISELSSLIQVNFFMFNPCKVYWGDLLTGKELLKAKEKIKDGFEHHISDANPLLSSMGKSGRDFFDMISSYETVEFELYEDFSGDSLLASIKNDILNCENNEGFSLNQNDRSVLFSSTHTESREIEILKDNILGIIENESINPEDIIVMAPDIENYTPFINAVFGAESGEKNSVNIPYSISDRTALSQSSLIRAFLDFLKMPETRMEASNVLSLLETEGILRKFNISDSDLSIIRKWIVESGIRWGIDSEHKKSEGLPCDNAFTWDHGFKRMFTGYAMPSYDEKIFMGIMAYDHIEGSYSDVLGRFYLFASEFFRFIDLFRNKKSISDWVLVFYDLLDSFFVRDDNSENEFSMVKDTLDEIRSSAESAGFNDEVNIKVIRSILSDTLSGKSFGGGFISRGITFCSMLPMRSIPFKCICLIGMNDDNYPRSSWNMDFDLIGKYPKKGDRSKRDDDRYLFLETLLSVEKILYISYVGQSIKDNSSIPPSVLVNELMDYVEYKCDGDSSIEELTAIHPLQPFNEEYFKGNHKIFNYSEEYFNASKALGRSEISVLCDEELDHPPNELTDIDLNSFISFFENPARFLLNRRGGIYVSEKDERAKDREPFIYTPLEAHKIERKILDKILRGDDPSEYVNSLTLSGNVPQGRTGEYLTRELLRKVKDISGEVKNFIKDPSELKEVRVNFINENVRITGFLENISDVMINFRYGSTRGKDIINAWIKHLFLNTLQNATGRSMLFDLTFDRKNGIWEPAVIEFEKTDGTINIINDLTDLYIEGLKKPLKFFPQSSLVYATEIYKKGKSEKDALIVAGRAFHGGLYNKGEKLFDDHFGISFRENPLDDEFERTAKKFFGPVFRYMDKKSLKS